jgi:hypothetical protein
MSAEIKPLVYLIRDQLTAVLFGMDDSNPMLSLTAGLRILEATYKIIEESKLMMFAQRADEVREIVALVPGGAVRAAREAAEALEVFTALDNPP